MVQRSLNSEAPTAFRLLFMERHRAQGKSGLGIRNSRESGLSGGCASSFKINDLVIFSSVGRSWSSRTGAAVSASGLAGDRCLQITSSRVAGMAIRKTVREGLVCLVEVILCTLTTPLGKALPVC